jgi:hypothetical protein
MLRRSWVLHIGDEAQTLWLTARTASSAFSVEIGGVVAVHCYAGCPGGQSRKNVLAVGGAYVLIHHVNKNSQPHHECY